MDYTGIKVTENANSAAAISALKIANGAHDIFTVPANGVMQDPDHTDFGSNTNADVKLISVTVDVASKVVSGYDSTGNRYIVDKTATVSLTLV